MLHTYHIHIKGIVQGVGFRPSVYKLATQYKVNGTVCNTTDGVHIEINAAEKIAHQFLQSIIQQKPVNSLITEYSIKKIHEKNFPDFTIIESDNTAKTNLLLTPDIAICNECKKEISNKKNRRYEYAFTTCLNCGPRYSIIKNLPYDRINTTMQHLQMCDVCDAEYHNVHNRRHYSQTNSCKDCEIKIHIYQSKNKGIVISNEVRNLPNLCTNAQKISRFTRNDDRSWLSFVTKTILEGKIWAIKGIGGFLLMCDATNEKTIKTLRSRKHRPVKPFALLYPSISSIKKDVELRPVEIDSLTSTIAPIVLCKRKKTNGNKICVEQIAPELDKIGVMLPYSPLLFSISTSINKPLIATSGNISGSPILYKDEDALENLFDIADYILTFDREIVAPQDDSVIQFSESEQKIIIRRSRGMAPNYFPNPFLPKLKNIFAAGAELKSAFAFTDENNLYVSQFLGNQGNVESQESYRQTQQHIVRLLNSKIKKILVDKHPNYFVTQAGIELAKKLNIAKPYSIQHHKAHFAAVLFENKLQQQNKKVLGIVWDGTGYGDDKQIWGGEFFAYEKKTIKRIAHFNYFPQLLGDKMSLEPRLSALSLLKNFPQHQSIIEKYFTKQEWNFYRKFIQQKSTLQTSSVGRLLDGIACLMDVSATNTYEGEAAMQLEALARNCSNKIKSSYHIKLSNGIIYWEQMIEGIIADMNKNVNKSFIAWKVFYTLHKSIILVSNQLKIHHLTFSGGVFQNALLVDMMKICSPEKKHLYFHKLLSANDECIGFGQIAYYELVHGA